MISKLRNYKLRWSPLLQKIQILFQLIQETRNQKSITKQLSLEENQLEGKLVVKINYWNEFKHRTVYLLKTFKISESKVFKKSAKNSHHRIKPNLLLKNRKMNLKFNSLRKTSKSRISKTRLKKMFKREMRSYKETNSFRKTET
jgi:hypothetical protein